MDSIQLKTKELQSKMYLSQTHRLRLIGVTKAVNAVTSPQSRILLKLSVTFCALKSLLPTLESLHLSHFPYFEILKAFCNVLFTLVSSPTLKFLKTFCNIRRTSPYSGIVKSLF